MKDLLQGPFIIVFGFEKFRFTSNHFDMFAENQISLRFYSNDNQSFKSNWCLLHLYTRIDVLNLDCFVGDRVDNMLIGLLLLQLSIGAAVLCIPVLRWTQPNLERPIRVNIIFPLLYLIATVFITVAPAIADPKTTGSSPLHCSIHSENTVSLYSRIERLTMIASKSFKEQKEEIEYSVMIPSFGLVRNWSTDWSDFDSFITFRWHLQFCLNWRTWIVLFCFVNVVVVAAAAAVVVVVWVLNWIATFALAGIGCLMMFSGVPVYLIFVYWKNKPAFVQKALGKIFVQNTTNLTRMTMFKMPSSSELIRYCMLI